MSQAFQIVACRRLAISCVRSRRTSSLLIIENQRQMEEGEEDEERSVRSRGLILNRARCRQNSGQHLTKAIKTKRKHQQDSYTPKGEKVVQQQKLNALFLVEKQAAFAPLPADRSHRERKTVYTTLLLQAVCGEGKHLAEHRRENPTARLTS